MTVKQYLIELKKMTMESNAFIGKAMKDHLRGLITDSEYAEVLTAEQMEFQHKMIDLAGRLALHEITG
jgi:hypothetical protein